MAVQISGNDITVPRDGVVTRNLTVGGVLTYEDVTNVDSKRRILSIIIALTDDYDGGVFNFPEQSYQVKLKKGEAITFPPNYFYPHEVSPPSNGERYSISLWVLLGQEA